MKQQFKVVDEKGRVLIPSELREMSGICKNDIVQISVYGNVLLINKANVNADNPIEVVKEEVDKEKRKEIEERLELATVLKDLFDSDAKEKEFLDAILNFKHKEDNAIEKC